MTESRNPDRLIRAFLSEGVEELSDQVYDSVRDQLHHNRQRAVIGRWRMPLMNSIIRIGLAAAVVLVVAFFGYQLWAGPSVGDQSPSPSASIAPSTTASPRALPFTPDQPLSAGVYSLGEGFPVTITFEIFAGWVTCSSGPFDLAVCKESTDTEPGSGVAFLIVDNVVADPCTTTDDFLDPPVGPTVDELVAALSSLEGFEATPPLDVTVDGFSGKQFTLTAPLDAGCALKTWTTEFGTTNGVGPGERGELRILDVDGVRVVINGAYQPETSDGQLSAIQQIIASVHIEP